jgi:nicotinamide-nucleotide amidase
VGINASGASILFRLSGEGATEAECYTAMQPVIDALRQHLGTLIFGEDGDELQDAVVRLLAQQGKTLAVAECGTAGLVTHWLAAAAESQGRFLGGTVMPREASENDAAVEDKLIRVMATDCRKIYAADYGLAIGPFLPADQKADQETESRSVFLALAGPDGIAVKETSLALHPAIVRVYCAKQALNMVRLALMERQR